MSKDKRPYPQDGNREGGLPELKKPRLSFSRLLFLLHTTTSVMRIEFSSKDALAVFTDDSEAQRKNKEGTEIL
jgi:hypothetical protein